MLPLKEGAGRRGPVHPGEPRFGKPIGDAYAYLRPMGDAEIFGEQLLGYPRTRILYLGLF